MQTLTKNLHYKIGEKVFDLIISIENGDKIGLIGPNGSGKSTLLKQINKGLGVGYLGQNSFLQKPRKLLYEYLLEFTEDWWNILSYGHETFGLDLQENSNLENISGGEWIKLRLSILSYDNPELLILDEPSNHLDLNGRQLLVKFIQNFKGSLIIASHDKSILANVNKIWELRDCLKVYGGNYSDYESQKELELNSQERKYILAKKELNKNIVNAQRESERAAKSIKTGKRLLATRSISRMAYGVIKNKAEQSAAINKKSLDKRLNDKENDVVKYKLNPLRKVHFAIENNSKDHSLLIKVKNGILTLPDKRVLISKIDFDLYNGEKVGILGDNGSGKSTFIKKLVDQNITGEEVFMKDRLKHIYIDQKYSIVDLNKSLIQNIQDFAPLSYEQVRMQLGNFLFINELDIQKKANVLSGGELARLAFAMATSGIFDLILLDEPTNNLDMETIKVIENVLSSYQGAMIVISHDLDFLKSIGVNKMYEIKDNLLERF